MLFKVWIVFVVVSLILKCDGIAESAQCSDCTDFKQCPGIQDFISKKASDSMKRFRDAICYFDRQNPRSYGVKVCCSMLQEVENRPTPQQIDLLPDRCGEINQDRIIGTEKVLPFDFTWLAVFNTTRTPKSHCTGSIINSKYILTAADCVKDVEVRTVRVGEYDLNTDLDCIGYGPEIDCSHHTDMDVEAIIVHEGFQWNSREHNIALIRLKSPINFKDDLDTLCLPKATKIQELSITNKRGLMVGWGNHESVLLKSYISVTNDTYCDNHYPRSAALRKHTLCALNMSKNSSCMDAGSPLIIPTKYGDYPRYVQYGILHSSICISPFRLYTDVASYMGWIAQNLLE
ncbi:unnamed protein product [Leptosia nina]|uniref:Peptidase S1 domain-containing protein n=1 Tax=Leptosia nina TaxID=320188 RepID=A0AAV1JUY5_9NEOP